MAEREQAYRAAAFVRAMGYDVGVLEWATFLRSAKIMAMLIRTLPKADPRRESFYEVESDSEVFYVHISPVNGRVLLIGIWPKSAISAMSFHATKVA